MSRSPSASTARIRCTACCAAPTDRSSRSIEGVPGRAKGGSSVPAGATSRCKGPETVVRVLETRRGAELRRLPHSHAVERLLHSNDGATLRDRRPRRRDRVVAARAGERGARAAARPHGRRGDASARRPTGGGSRSRATTAPSPCSTSPPAPSSIGCGSRARVPVTRTQLSADGTELVTQSGDALRVVAACRQARDAAQRRRSTTCRRRSRSTAANDARRRRLGERPAAARAGAAAAARAPSLSFFGHRGADHGRGVERRPRSRRDGRQRRHRARVGPRFRRADGRRRAAGRRARRRSSH